MTDVKFTLFPFAATGTGTMTGVTQPDRLARDVINVKDWNAQGDGVTDDTDAIQAAIDYAYSNVPTNTPTPFSHGAIIYLPPGIYIIGKGGTAFLRLSAPRSISDAGFLGSAAIKFVGAGRDATILKGSFSTGATPLNNPGFLVQSTWFYKNVNDPNSFTTVPPQCLEDMTIWNTSTVDYSGAYMWRTGGNENWVRRCRFIGVIALYYGQDGFGGEVTNCIALNSRVYTGGPFSPPVYPTADAYTPFSSSETVVKARSTGIWIEQGLCRQNQVDGFDIGFTLAGDFGSGNAIWVNGNRASRCKIGFAAAYGAQSNSGGNVLSGTTIAANHANRCELGFYIYNMGAGAVLANTVTGKLGVADPQSMTMTWAANTATVTTAAAHNIAVDTTVQIQVPTAWSPSGTGVDNVAIHRIDATHFSYTLNSNPGGASSAGSGWTWPLQAGISSAGSSYAMAANTVQSTVSFAQVDLTNLNGNTGNALTVMSMHTPDANGWRDAGGDASFTSCSGGAGSNVVPLAIMTVKKAAIASTAFGATFNVTDAQSAAIGGVVATSAFLASDAHNGDTLLTFTSLPSSVTSNNGMTVFGTDQADGDIGGSALVGTVSGNTVNLNAAGGGTVIRTVPAGTRFVFFTGGLSHYKLFGDGINLLRVG